MFDNAQLCFIADHPVEGSDNRFTLNGGSSRKIFGGPNMYRIKAGEQTVKVISGNGDEWTVIATVKYQELLTIKLVLSGNDICDVLYKVEKSHPLTARIGVKLY